MHCVSGSWNSFAAQIGKFIYSGLEDLRDKVWSFPIRPELPGVRLGGVLKDFLENLVPFMKSSLSDV